MEAFLQWGLDLILAIQQVHGPALDSIFLAITSLGAEEFYLLLVPLIFWCVDFGFGARMAVLLLLSSYLNVYLKDLFQQPRPFDLDPSVQLAPVGGYGLPSGHAQSAVVVWGVIAAWARQRWFWGVAIGLMALIGFSRIYLGLHFPTDVLGGWMIGGLLLGLYVVTHSRVAELLAESGLGWQLVLVLGLPLVLLVIHPVKDTTMTTGALAGAGVGLVLSHRYISFSAHGPLRQRVLRFVIGAVVVVLLYAGLKTAFPGEESSLYLVFRFLRFGFVGLWASLGAPWLFKILRLAPSAENAML